jgi:dienelactone hydrolase
MQESIAKIRSARIIAAVLVVFSSCTGDDDGGSVSDRGGSKGSSTTQAASHTDVPRINEECPYEVAHLPAESFRFRASDGTRLYGAILGRGPVGVVLANDVPHELCEPTAVAAYLARRGLRAMVFDYRDHGLSESNPPHEGRLDLDVAAAVRRLRHAGVKSVVLTGAYGGAAAVIVAATVSIGSPVAAIVNVSPAARRGQYIEGPFGPMGALQVAARVRAPVLTLTVRNDRYVSVASVKRLQERLGSSDMRLAIFADGPAGWGLHDYSAHAPQARRQVIRFIRNHIPS